MTIDPHALASIASSLEEMTDRIRRLTADIGADDDDALLDLAEVQRQLTTASRRLDKIVHRQRT